MTKSRLYEEALAALGGRQSDWTQAENRIGAVVLPDPANGNGADVVEIIQSENHLSADPPRFDPAVMCELLADLADVPWPDEPVDIRDTYDRVVGRYALRGKAVDNAPGTHFRYVNGPAIFAKGIPAALGGPPTALVADALLALITAAERGDGGTTWQDVLDEVRDPVLWGSLPRDQVHLARPGSASMFVTFDDSNAGIDRDSATTVHAALALWWPRNDACFVELPLPTTNAAPLHVPTLADAGWYGFFRSAAPDAGCGWTNPHPAPPGLPPQPEAVRAPGTLEELLSSSDLRIVPM